MAMNTISYSTYDAPKVDLINITLEHNMLQGSVIDNPGGDVPGSGDGGDD